MPNKDKGTGSYQVLTRRTRGTKKGGKKKT